MTGCRGVSTVDRMTSLTTFVLRHRMLVVVAWVAVAVAGAMTVSTSAGRLSKGFATPGTAGYGANLDILQRLGVDGNEQPSLGVLHLPPGQSMRTASGRALAAAVPAAPRRFPVRVRRKPGPTVSREPDDLGSRAVYLHGRSCDLL
jgi:RND superfamily putative drug exporter